MTNMREVAPVLRTLSSALLLCALFVMVSGDLSPRPFDSPSPLLQLPILWPGLYLALLILSVLVSLAAGRSLPDLLAPLRPLRFLRGPVIGLTAAFLLSALCSPEVSLSLTGFGYYLVLLCLLLLVQRSVWEADPDQLWRAIALAALVLAARTIGWRLDEGLGVPAAQIRNNAWLGKLQIAWVLGMLAPVAFGRFLSASERRWRWLFLAAWLLCGTAILFLWAKTAIGAFAISTLLLCALSRASWRRWLPTVAGTILLVLAAFLGTLSVSGALSGPAGKQALESESALRLRIWQDSFRMFLDHPLTGIGLGTYDALAYTTYLTQEDVGPGGRNWFYMKGWHAHNMFVQVLAETGLLGFLAWLSLLGALAVYFLRAWRTARSEAARLDAASMLCCLASFVVLTQTEAMLAVRVHESLRMNLTLWMTLLIGIRTVVRSQRPSPAGGDWAHGGRPADPSGRSEEDPAAGQLRPGERRGGDPTEPTPLVSIALCTFNGEQYLSPQLQSILAQTYARLEVVVLDDGSTDGTLELLEEHARRDARIRLHRNDQRLGFIRNFERAITLCTGELIALSDQDDIWHPEKIERLLRRLNGHLLVYHDSELIDADGSPLGKQITDLGACIRGHHPLAFIFGNCVSGHSLLFRRELVPHLLPFPTCFYHDQWLALVASSLGTIEFVEDCLVQYRRHESAAFQQLASQNSHRGEPRSGARRARDFVAGEENYLARIAVYAQHPACADPRTMNRLLRLYRMYMRSYFSPGLALFLLAHPDLLVFLYARRPHPSMARLGWVLRHVQGVRLRALARRLDLKAVLGRLENH